MQPHNTHVTHSTLPLSPYGLATPFLSQGGILARESNRTDGNFNRIFSRVYPKPPKPSPRDTRQWVVSVPIPLRYWTAASKTLTATVHTIILKTIRQFYVNKVDKHGIDRKQAQPGSGTFVQRFGSSINVNLHYHFLCLESVYLEIRSAASNGAYVSM